MMEKKLNLIIKDFATLLSNVFGRFAIEISFSCKLKYLIENKNYHTFPQLV